MVAAKRIAEQAEASQQFTPSVARPVAPTLANDQTPARPSPARMLQAELHRALTPGPVAPDRFSKRRAFKFIAPSGAAFWACIAIVNHLSHV